MKWPAMALDARLKASLRRLFNNGRTGKKEKSPKMLHAVHEVTHGSGLLDCTWFESKYRPTATRSSYSISSPEDGYTKQPEVSMTKTEHDVDTDSAHIAPTSLPARKVTTDACVNTDEHRDYGYCDAYTQADVDGCKVNKFDKSHEDQCGEGNSKIPTPLRLSEENTQLPTFVDGCSQDASNPLQLLPSEQCNRVALFQYSSEPILLERKQLVTSAIDCDNGLFIHAGDTCLRQVNSSLAGADQVTQPSRRACETHLSHCNWKGPLHSSSQRCMDTQSYTWGEFPRSSIPRAAWYFSNGKLQDGIIEFSVGNTQSSPIDNRGFISEDCSPIPGGNESTGEQNDRYINIANRAKNFQEVCTKAMTNPVLVQQDFVGAAAGSNISIPCDTRKWITDSESSVKQEEIQANTAGQTDVWSDDQRRTDSSMKDEPTLTTELSTDRPRCPIRRQHEANIHDKMTQTRDESDRRRVTGSRHFKLNSHDRRQIIHHNGVTTSFEKAEKSGVSLKKSGVHSTSDDGDATKKASSHRNLKDQSSTSSALGILGRSKQKENSPTQPKRYTKLRGALPAISDLNQCPTGRHLDVKAEKPCICILVKRLVIEQSKPVRYSWHTRNPNTALIETAHSKFHGRVTDENNVPSVPYLSDFQLARPTRVVRGGQGTVVWVTCEKTGQFYALKFKQRDGRSDSTWAIERREAELLRTSRHEFIVKLFHIYETDETIFMALEWLDGGCLWNHIARIGTMPECYAVYYTACILKALCYLHENFVVYRDMKAENIVLDKRGRPKLIDFGMAKKFGGQAENKQDTEAGPEDLDSAEFDEPPTRYYFAAYLAPEIYDEHSKIDPLIDSWGLGYILVELLLGYGIFLPMPWEDDPGQHLTKDWKLQLPPYAKNLLSPNCTDFVHKMLLRQPTDRLTMKEAQEHNLFSRVPWPKLTNMRGPDLTKCPSKSASQENYISTAQKRWTGKPNSSVHIPDMAFVREFYGSVANPTMMYATQMLAPSYNTTRKHIKPVARRQSIHETEQLRSSSNGIKKMRAHAALEGAVVIRATHPNLHQKTNNMKGSRINRQEG